MTPLRSTILAAAVLAGPCARALSVEPPTFPELVAKADTIVRAEVTGRRCEWRDTRNGPVIVTLVTFRIEAALKGGPTGEITLRHLGGQVGDRVLEIPGLPQFEVGDRDYLFIEGNGRAICPLVAIPHGRYPVVRDAATGADFVARADGTPLGAVAEVSRPLHAEAARVPPAKASAPMRAPDFEAAVRAELARPQVPRQER